MKTFAFGMNWKKFNTSYLNEKRLKLAKKALCSFLDVTDLKGKSFIDVGSGSGLFSLAAFHLGASTIMSFDVDVDSVDCTEKLRAEAGNAPHWQVRHGSVLDDKFVSTLSPCDVVYSWGVLHHTGNLWKAIENTLMLVNRDGLLYLAIYNKADGLALYPDGRFGSSAFWKWEKRIYAGLPAVLQNLIDYVVMGVLIVFYCITFHNPISVIRDHQNYFSKGMSWRINVTDWLGGYPYEYASVAEVFDFVRRRGFSLENLTCNNGLLNNEFLFRKLKKE